MASIVPSASATVTETGTTRPTSVSVAAEAVAVTANSAGLLGSSADHAGGVVEVHQAQQALDDREAGVGDRRADRGEHRRPAAADQRVGHDGQAGRQRRPERGRDPGVVGDPLRGPIPTFTVAVPSTTGGQESGPSTPAAIASTARIAVAASSVDTTGRAAVD